MARAMTTTAPTTAPPANRYAAFISYSRQVDASVARALQEGLHSFAKPWYRRRALRVFRDDASLSATPALWSSIQRGLDESEYFILLCSPAAASSVWVAREITYWLATKPPQRLLLAVTEGELVWDRGVGDFDWSRTTALPPTLRGTFREEPRHVDLTTVRDNPGRLRSRGSPELVADLAATLHGRPKDDLIGRDLRIHRRNRAIAAAAIVALLLLAAAAVVFGLDSRAQQREAERERALSDQFKRAAVARSLALASQTTGATPETLIRMAIAAQALDPTGQTHNALVRLLTTNHHVATLPLGQADVQNIIFASPTTIVTGDTKGSVVLWDVSRPRSPHLLATIGYTEAGQQVTLAASADGKRLLVGGNTTARVFDISNPGQPQQLSILEHDPGGAARGFYSPIGTVALSPDGRSAVTASSAGPQHLWDLSDPAHPRDVPAPYDLIYGVTSFTFVANGHTALTTGTPAGTNLWDLSDIAHPRRLATIPDTGARKAALSADGHLALLTGFDTVATLWSLADPARPRILGTLARHSGDINGLALSRDGRVAITGSQDETAVLWDLSNPNQPRSIGVLPNVRAVNAVDLSPDGTTAVTAGEQAAVWRVASPTSTRQLATFDNASQNQVGAVAIAPDGRTALTGSQDVARWDLSDPAAPRRTADMVDTVAKAGAPPDAGRGVYAIQYSPDGRTALTGGYGGDDGQPHTPNGPDDAILWDMTAPSGPRQLAVLDHSNAVDSLGFGPPGIVLTASDEYQANLWDVTAPGDPDSMWRANLPQEKHVNVIATNSPGTLALTAGDQTAQVWDLTDPARPVPLSRLNASAGITAMRLTRNGHIALLGLSSGRLELWDLSHPSDPHPLTTLTDHASSISTIDVTPDGRFAVSAESDGLTILWDLTNTTDPVRLAALTHDGLVRDLSVNADGRLLVATTSGAVLWDVSAPYALAVDPTDLACSIVGRGLNPDEWSTYAPGVPYQDTCPR
jgi:WD40 repeat protein